MNNGSNSEWKQRKSLFLVATEFLSRKMFQKFCTFQCCLLCVCVRARVATMLNTESASATILLFNIYTVIALKLRDNGAEIWLPTTN